MIRQPRKPTSSIDGFISNPARRVGFERPKTAEPPRTVPTRRTSFRSQPQHIDGIGTRATKPIIGDPLSTRPASKLPLPESRRPLRRGQHPEANIPKRKRFSLGKIRNWPWKKIIKRGIIVLLILGLLGGGWFGWKVLRNSNKAFGGNILGFLNSTKLNGEDQGRVNILLTGVSTDDVGHEGANLTDSIMIISLNTRDNQASMISVPRDLWVDVPGHGHTKINAANVYGDDSKFKENGYPSGGMGLLQKTLSQTLDIKINYYAKINYSAIRDGVNAVGGIDFTVQSSDRRGLYDSSIDWTTRGPMVRLSNGTHHLDGREALNLSRARGDGYGSYGFPRSDFDRTENQRKMLLALRHKIMSTSTLSNPLKIAHLFDTLGKNVKTNFKTSEVRRLYELGKKIDAGNIASASFNDAGGVNLLANYRTSGGQSALIPAAGVDNFTDIRAYIQRVFSSNPIVKEDAKVVVLNGTKRSGLAADEKGKLTTKNINVVAVSDASATAKTVIIDLSGGKAPATKQALVDAYGNNLTTSNKYGYTGATFIVVLGADRP